MCKRNYKNEDKSDQATILFTLAPDFSNETGILVDGKDKVYKTYKTYKKYLDIALGKKDILNIAVTGEFGIGKSSFLNWYAQDKKCLFVSLCDYSNGAKDLFSLGCDIYRQLMIKSGRAKEISRKRKGWVLFGITLFFTAIVCFYLLYYDAFGSLARFAEIFLPPGKSRYELFKSIINARKIVDCITVSAGLIGVPLLAKWTFSRIASAKLSVKAKDVEAEMQLERKEKSLSFDLNKVNIVEELRKSAKEFDHVVIFEDFDRTSPDNCIALFTELRELNRLINGSLGLREKQVRFVYVLKDDLFCSKFENKQSGEDDQTDDQLEKCDRNISLKFFDVIIPFVPGIYGRAASANIREVLAKVNVKEEYIGDYIYMVSKYLYDYRTIRNIANEFSVIKAVYAENNTPDDSDDKYILALATYKTIMPEEYACIRSGNPKPFAKIETHENLCIQALANKGWLGDHCLMYIGLNPNEMKNYISKLDENADKTGETIRGFINSCYSMVRGAMLYDTNFLSRVLKFCAYSVLEKELSSKETIDLLEKAITSFTEETKESWDSVNSSNSLFSLLNKKPIKQKILGVRYLLEAGCVDWDGFTFDADLLIELYSGLSPDEKAKMYSNAKSILVRSINSVPSADWEKLKSKFTDNDSKAILELAGIRQDIINALGEV